MVLQVHKYDILPDKVEAYNEWAGAAMSRLRAVPGLVEFRGYRAVTGTFQVVVTQEFEDMASWAAYWEDEEFRKVREQGRQFTTNWSLELWGPSPVAPKPIRPGE